ncbi:MAG: ABC transporter substrate-binding protein [Cellulomonadaceae bacterium]|nr:ABC transporter substrate-binding protein [Cellulomonadaceae bacterium]
MPSTVRPRPLALLALPGVLLLAACGAQSAAAPQPTSTATADASVAATAYPLTLDNCGFELTLDAAPQRVVAIKSSSIEMLLALGVGDRIVGTGFPDGPVPEQYADAAAGLTELSDHVPAAEVVLGAEPDLVYAGWESNLTADGAGDRAALAALGVATYVAPSACKDPAYQPDHLTFDEVFTEITEAGDLLGVPDAAAALVADQRAELDALVPDDRGATALWYSSGFTSFQTSGSGRADGRKSTASTAVPASANFAAAPSQSRCVRPSMGRSTTAGAGVLSGT